MGWMTSGLHGQVTLVGSGHAKGKRQAKRDEKGSIMGQWLVVRTWLVDGPSDAMAAIDVTRNLYYGQVDAITLPAAVRIDIGIDATMSRVAQHRAGQHVRLYAVDCSLCQHNHGQHDEMSVTGCEKCFSRVLADDYSGKYLG